MNYGGIATMSSTSGPPGLGSDFMKNKIYFSLDHIMPNVPPLVRKINKSWEERLAEKEAKWHKEIKEFKKIKID
jgi:hypothetical protein